MMANRDLRIKRLTLSTFAWQVIGINGSTHTRVKIGRWLCALILASPRVAIGHYIGESPGIALYRSPEQFSGYMTPMSDGIKWKVDLCNSQAEDQDLE